MTSHASELTFHDAEPQVSLPADPSSDQSHGVSLNTCSVKIDCAPHHDLISFASQGNGCGCHGHTEPPSEKGLLFSEWQEVAVMVIQGLLLESSPFLRKARGSGHGHTGPSSQSKAFLSCWASEGVVVMIIQLSLLGKGRGGGHEFTKPSSKSDAPLFLERQGVVVMVILCLLS